MIFTLVVVIVPLITWIYIYSNYCSKDYLDALKVADLVPFSNVFPLDGNGLQSQLMSELYDNSIMLYNSRSTFPNQNDFDDLLENFKYLYEKHNYKKLGNYLKIVDCLAHPENERTFGSTVWMIDNLNFLNSKDVIMYRFEDAIVFLEGKWKSSNGKYYFNLSIDENGSSIHYNLPFKHSEGDYNINDGYLWLGNSDPICISINNSDQITLSTVLPSLISGQTYKEVILYKSDS